MKLDGKYSMCRFDYDEFRALSPTESGYEDRNVMVWVGYILFIWTSNTPTTNQENLVNSQCIRHSFKIQYIHASCTWFAHRCAWWRHQMETFSALLAICVGNSPVPGEFPAQRPVTRSFDVFFDLRQIKRLNKQSWGWWFETLSRPVWRHSNGLIVVHCLSNLPISFTFISPSTVTPTPFVRLIPHKRPITLICAHVASRWWDVQRIPLTYYRVTQKNIFRVYPKINVPVPLYE